MKAAFILAIAGAAVAQFPGEPSCAIPCLTSAISAASCALTDVGCQCGTAKAVIATKVTPCLLTACNGSDLGVAASVGNALCSSYSAGLTATTTPTITTPYPTSAPSGGIPAPGSNSTVITKGPTPTPPAPTAPSGSGAVGASSPSMAIALVIAVFGAVFAL